MCRGVWTGGPAGCERRAGGCVSRMTGLTCHFGVLGFVMRGGSLIVERLFHIGVIFSEPLRVVARRTVVPSVSFMWCDSFDGIVMTRLFPDFQIVCNDIEVLDGQEWDLVWVVGLWLAG